MSSVVIAGDTSGTITLAAPAVSGTTTLTLPATSGTVLTNASNTGFPAGSVIQVVQGTYATQIITSAGPVDTGLTASITPSSSANKILVFVSQLVYLYSSANTGCILNLLRGATSIVTGSGHTLYVDTSGQLPEIIAYINYHYLDSPATTSSTTYKTQITATAGGTSAVNWSNNTAMITLMEIKG